MAQILADLKLTSIGFRQGLDRLDAVYWSAQHVRCFPRGACGHAAELLGRYLRERLGIECTYVNGWIVTSNERCSHTWLEYRALVIDITADQFGMPAVFVGIPSDLYGLASSVVRQGLSSDPGWWQQQCGALWTALMLDENLKGQARIFRLE